MFGWRRDKRLKISPTQEREQKKRGKSWHESYLKKGKGKKVCQMPGDRKKGGRKEAQVEGVEKSGSKKQKLCCRAGKRGGRGRLS